MLELAGGVNRGSRIINLMGGAVTVGPGKVVAEELKEHIRSHSDARTFLCGFCGKALKNRQCLNRHLFTHGVKYTCQVCGKNFANPSSLNVHKRDRHGLNV